MPNKLDRRLTNLAAYSAVFDSPQVDALYPEQVTTSTIHLVTPIVTAAEQFLEDGRQTVGSMYDWLGVFGPGDLRLLIKEITESYEKTGYTANGLANRDALIYDWYVRATAVTSCAVFDSSPPVGPSKDVSNTLPLAALEERIAANLRVTPAQYELNKLYLLYKSGAELPDEATDELQAYCDKAFLVADQSVVTNDNGGSQSHTGTRYDLLPYSALDIISQVLYSGAIKYGDDNWKRIPTHEHLNHALRHLLRFGLTGDTEELSHGACRALFALTIHIEGVHTDEKP